MARCGRSSIVCPYHAWVYDLQGAFASHFLQAQPCGFDVADYPLYKINVREWNGFVFVALTENPPPFERMFDLPLNRLDAWPLGDLARRHVLLKKTSRATGKFSGRTTTSVCIARACIRSSRSLVPIYGRGLLEERDDPNWSEHAADPDPKYKGGLRAGADVLVARRQIDRRAVPRAFRRGPQGRRHLHDRFALDVHRRPRRLCAGGAPATLWARSRPSFASNICFRRRRWRILTFDLRNIVEFTNLVMTEDAEVCELNQRGLHAAPHRSRRGDA